MALILPEIDEDEAYPQELIDLGSRNHSYLQGRIASLIDQSYSDRFIPFLNLSLDVSTAPFDDLNATPREQIQPDICLYPTFDFNFYKDEIQMIRMPSVVIEILSPLEGTYPIMEKFRVYFALGVQSCWMVTPILKLIAVYTPTFSSFVATDDIVQDEKMGIELSLDNIFKR